MSEKKSRRSGGRGAKTTRAVRPAVPLTEAEARLVHALPQVSPRAEVREQLLARVRAAKANTAGAEAAWRFVAAGAAGGWLTMPFPGVRLKELTVDAKRDTALLMIEMAAGARFPDHVHAADERGVVLSGDLEMDGRRLATGDFYEAAAGTRHERVSSPSGCTGLLWVGAAAWNAWRAAAAV